MAKVVSKQNFLSKLKLYSSFCFNDDECDSILNDYEEWFENESALGKEESEICSALGNPRSIVKNLVSESEGSVKIISIILHNTMWKALFSLCIIFFASMFVLICCDKNAQDYFYFALCINFLYFFTILFITKNTAQYNNYKNRGNILVTGLFAMSLLSEIFVLPKLIYPQSGRYCVIIISLIILMLGCLNIYLIIKSFIQNKRLDFITIFHISGIITFMFFLINQLHMLYDSTERYRNQLIVRSVLIYIEIIFLCVILYNKGKIHMKEKG